MAGIRWGRCTCSATHGRAAYRLLGVLRATQVDFEDRDVAEAGWRALVASFGAGEAAEWAGEWLGMTMFFAHAGEEVALQKF
jgi:hypothetical protein